MGLTFTPVLLFGQVKSEQKDKGSSAPLSTRAQRKKAKKEWKENRKREWDNKKKIKEHDKKFQTKKTLRRMKRDKRKAQLNNEHKKEIFIRRWFTF